MKSLYKKIRRLIPAVLAVFSATAFNGCISNGSMYGSNFQDTIQKGKDKVFPAVVYVRGLKDDMQRGRKIASAVTGSGVIISDNGEILTNWHVVNKMKDIRCQLYDGSSYDADLIGADKDTDLALIKLKLPVGHKPVTVAEIQNPKDLKEGDFVMAMGAPWGLNRSVSIGIISCAKRYLPQRSQYSLWYQTDASISPGNSGGPLVNSDGYVIGINTLGSMAGGDMGFAVPAATILKVIPRIRKYGKVNWAWTGIMLQPLKDFNLNMTFNFPNGVMVAGTDPESPARVVGLMDRDRIVKINGKPVTAVTAEDVPAIRSMLALMPFEKKIDLTVVRDGKTVQVALIPREKGQVEGDEVECSRWDFTVKSINQFDNPELYFHCKKGVFIYGLEYPGNAIAAGLRVKDIILKIGDQPIKSLSDIKKIYDEKIKNIKKNHKVLITVLRNGLMYQVVLDFSRDYDKD
jgi:serine protease Do